VSWLCELANCGLAFGKPASLLVGKLVALNTRSAGFPARIAKRSFGGQA